MRKFFTLLFTITTILVSAQIFTPVSWDFSQNQLSENEVELIFKASIDEHWHLYSQDIADCRSLDLCTFRQMTTPLLPRPAQVHVKASNAR